MISHSRSRWVPIAIREHHERWWLMVFAAFFVGALTVVPSELFDYRPPTVRVINQLPGGVEIFGIVLMCIGLTNVIARFISSKVMRVVHAASAGYYGLLTVVLLFSLFGGEPYTGLTIPYMVIMSWLHFRAGTESEPLVKTSIEQGGSGVGEST